MKKFILTDKIIDTKVLQNSVDGGARYLVFFENYEPGTAKGKIGYQVGYWIENQTHTFEAHYTKNNNLILDKLIK